MMISPPFLPTPNADDDLFVSAGMPGGIDLAPGSGGAPLGSYPLTTSMTWHNGLHITAPRGVSHALPVRAIADGAVIFKKHPAPANKNLKDPQNYNPYGSEPAWTDNGIVIIRHTTEIGATGTVGTALNFYSVYMHLSSISAAVVETKPIGRKDVIGESGQILGSPNQIHFEICLDPNNLQNLMGSARATSWIDPETVPTENGRTDSVFGSIYVYLPAGTPSSISAPTHHLQASSPKDQAAPTTLSEAQWVEIRYDRGSATLSSYRATSSTALKRQVGDPIGTSHPDPNGEYGLYDEAKARHTNAVAAGATSSPSGWYELLRFGRNLCADPLPANAAHWRKISSDSGTVWADLNAPGSKKFSDADFPAFKGWNCFDDDTSHDNQRCDSVEIKRLIRDPEVPESILKRDALARRLGVAQVREKLKRAICRFPTEWDKDTISQRYDWLKGDAEFNITEGPAWDDFKAHAESISFAGLPDEYKNAIWHLHPRTFISHMRQCGWLQKADLKKIFETISEPYLTQVVDEINKVSGKHFLNSALRQSHFFGQVRQEAGPTMAATSENLNYAPAVLNSKFSYYSAKPAEADADGYTKSGNRITKAANQEAIANKAYGKPRLGNVESDDGWRFRGRGLKQLTGRKNYMDLKREYEKYWARDAQDFVASPQLVIQLPYSVRSAVWFWVSQSCVRAADKGMGDAQVDAVSHIVNSGETGEPHLNRRLYAKKSFDILN